ncbi:MAG: hypothetical protein ACJ8FS_08650 [Sphingomicrobium sp.]
MDRRQGPTRFLIAAAALLLCGAATTTLPMRDARWLQSTDLAADLTHQPVECRSRYGDAAQERSAEIGRIAFRAPLLLGGQAARAGLSCSSCHRNGRSNAHFHFPGISGDPGTADVTASLMSSHRGDGIFNPKPIPDLAGDPAKLKVSRDPKSADLRNFIHGLITQEFDGPEPPNSVLDGLVAYVRSLSPSACKAAANGAIRLGSMLDDTDRAVRLSEQSYADGDKATARLLIGAARSILGKIDERFELAGGEPSRALLRDTDADLKVMEHADAVSPDAFRRWRRAWPARAHQLREAETRSYFSEAVLRQALKN